MNRAEHLAWCKQRALEFLDGGDKQQARMSMLSDLSKHEELSNHSGIKLGMLLLVNGYLHSDYEIRNWIEGFN